MVAKYEDLPLTMLCSSKFGLYPKISPENVFNMYKSDDWMVSFPGYKKILQIEAVGKGRGAEISITLGKIICVIDDSVYLIDKTLSYSFIGSIETFSGSVYIAENNSSQIAICDKKNIYIYNYKNFTFQKLTLDFRPIYICFQDGVFVAPEADRPIIRISEYGDGTIWDADKYSEGNFQSKPNKPKACIPIPSARSSLFVFGDDVVEPWTFIGNVPFPYVPSGNFLIDYGVANVDTIAVGDKFVVWLGINKKSGLSILMSSGGEATQISTDGINSVISKMTNPFNSFGNLFQKDGHIFYVLTFVDDKVSLLYDFTTDKGYYITDQNQLSHPLKKVLNFNEKLYFISNNDGCIYELSSDYNTADEKIIPRIIQTQNFRQTNSMPFVVNNINFPIEMGCENGESNIDLSFSIDGGENYHHSVRTTANKIGKRKNIYRQYNFGLCNEISFQFRFYGNDRVALTNGTMRVYQ